MTGKNVLHPCTSHTYTNLQIPTCSTKADNQSFTQSRASASALYSASLPHPHKCQQRRTIPCWQLQGVHATNPPYQHPSLQCEDQRVLHCLNGRTQVSRSSFRSQHSWTPPTCSSGHEASQLYRSSLRLFVMSLKLVFIPLCFSRDTHWQVDL